jgi:hypothetical protein
MANFGILPAEEAAFAEVLQDAVYLFADGSIARYA